MAKIQNTAFILLWNLVGEWEKLTASTLFVKSFFYSIVRDIADHSEQTNLWRHPHTGIVIHNSYKKAFFQKYILLYDMI